MHFTYVVCLTVSRSLIALSKFPMGKYSKASKQEKCGIRRLASSLSDKPSKDIDKPYRKGYFGVGRANLDTDPQPLDAHEATALTLADKMLKLPIFRQAQIENTSCKPMMQTFNKKLEKKKQLDRWRRRAQHRQRVLANKIATYNQDDDANSSCSSSSSSTSE